MMQERIESKWVDAFTEVLRLCGVQCGENAAILSETQSRPFNVQLAELALQNLGARVFHLMLVTLRLQAPVPVRSTGASDATGANEVAGRHTLGHFDLPLRNCTVTLDANVVLDKGRLQGELA